MVRNLGYEDLGSSGIIDRGQWRVVGRERREGRKDCEADDQERCCWSQGEPAGDGVGYGVRGEEGGCGSRIYGLEFRVHGLRSRVQGSEEKVL